MLPLPLPVEFVAGGEGRPDPAELLLALGLGGSGRSGMESTVSMGGVEKFREEEEEEVNGKWTLEGLGPM